MPREHIHFVTGRFAADSLRHVLADLAPQAGFDYSIDVLGITVAALMSPHWMADRIAAPPTANRIMIPGYCAGDLTPVRDVTGLPVERGPRDLRRLPEFFGKASRTGEYGGHDIQILAEINGCPRRSVTEIVAEADRLAVDGADLIDVGCEPGATWLEVDQAVRALRDAGHRVSIDSMNPAEVSAAVRAGAELVLSVNRVNRRAAADWGAEVVVIPDPSGSLDGIDETIGILQGQGVPLRVDPIVEPIGFGFAASLGRFLEIRRRHPDLPMLMGIGNLTELTDTDSCGINCLLLGFCQELGIRSVLTTQVINWARTSVRECAVARQLVHYAVQHRVLPKHVEPRLVMLRDTEPVAPTAAELDRLARDVRDGSLRIFVSDGRLHVVGAGLHLEGADPFDLFARLLAVDDGRRAPGRIDPSHAFYLGFELCKAATALVLSKQYEQDEPLDWGLLTAPKVRHHRS